MPHLSIGYRPDLPHGILPINLQLQPGSGSNPGDKHVEKMDWEKVFKMCFGTQVTQIITFQIRYFFSFFNEKIIGLGNLRKIYIEKCIFRICFMTQITQKITF